MVDLSTIHAAVFSIAASEDHLCPPAASYALNDVVASSDETAITVPGGHLGSVIGSRARHVLWTRLVEWLEPRAGHREERT